MAFFQHPQGPLPFSLRRAVIALAAYGIVTLTYQVWLLLSLGVHFDELILGAVRIVFGLGVAFAISKRMGWARWAGIVGGVIGGLGLVAAGMSLASGGPSAFPLGAVGAAYAVLSTVLLVVPATQLVRGDARAAFSHPAAPSA
ncbi:MAG: hypothetical protein HY553_11975 [Elusimicrobia bacterium]|nr:hypothetical protein [Elusimicrobiota bacterium]